MAIDLVDRQFGPRQYGPMMDSQPSITILGQEGYNFPEIGLVSLLGMFPGLFMYAIAEIDVSSKTVQVAVECYCIILCCHWFKMTQLRTQSKAIELAV